MKSGEWRVKSEEWRVESGEWRVESYLIDTRSIQSGSAQSFKQARTPPPATGRIIQG